VYNYHDRRACGYKRSGILLKIEGMGMEWLWNGFGMVMVMVMVVAWYWIEMILV
jgi:hypothetical protein